LADTATNGWTVFSNDSKYHEMISVFHVLYV